MFIGAGAMISAFRLADSLQVLPNPGVALAVSIGVFFVAWTGALLLYLNWRDKSRASIVNLPGQPDPHLEGTVYGMIPEREYQVMKSFTDYYGNSFERGEKLQFKQRHFLPYHDGHTLVFKGRTLYLQEEQNKEILDHFSEYIALINSESF